MLQLTAIGRLTKDPEIKKNNKGNDFVVFDLAVNKGYGENQTTVFVSCCAGGVLVNPLSKAKKGSLITITGELSTELYQKRDGSTGENVKCLISSFNFISTGSGQKNNQQNQNNSNQYGNSQYHQGQQGGNPQYNQGQPQQQYQQRNPQSYQSPQQYANPNNYAPQNYSTPAGYEEVPVNGEALPF